MNKLFFAPIFLAITFASVPPALSQDRSALQVTTQEYANRIKAQFDECMRPVGESGIHSGNGVILDCLQMQKMYLVSRMAISRSPA